MMSLWDALRMNMMISYQELVRTFPNALALLEKSSFNFWFFPVHLTHTSYHRRDYLRRKVHRLNF
ncbi:hypothetical protein CT147_05285 [Escherichia coli]|nr:hypothetical protein BW690_04370 [Escherichia coli]OUK85448.1 hypothetical protein BZL68_16045 [Escherichia coli]OZR95196.1 hypothetical protein CIG25_26520 [Escherichia coli]PIM39325.1 hypothetical protein CT147_05285 [Escherichia coli]